MVLLFFTGIGLAVMPPSSTRRRISGRAYPTISTAAGNKRSPTSTSGSACSNVPRPCGEPGSLGLTAAGGVLGVGRVVFSAFFSALTVLILTLYFLANLPSIKAQAYRVVPRSRRARVGLLTDEILARVGGYVAGAVSIAARTRIQHLCPADVPAQRDYAVALAMLVFLTGLIPLIGATIGAIILRASRLLLRR